ncbi:succinate-semialdehyde dehydrogenase [Crenothrix sp. D3]|nr:succinate-semialdehyde dehydrogenase [Crenothrix sp. D3]
MTTVNEQHSQISEMVLNAHNAQQLFETFSQDKVDSIVCAIGKYVYDHAELLGQMCIDETGIGNLPDKTQKSRSKSTTIWANLKDKKSRGIIGEDVEKGLIFVAKPIGVVAAITPITNPVVTPMCNTMFALKCGNAIIIAPHPKAQQVATYLCDAFMNIVREHNGPENLIQVVKNGSVEMSQELMRTADVIIATGGKAMVEAAYSSGKPAFGVGPGNVPVIVDRQVNLEEAAAKILLSAAFDNSLICSHEQCVLVPEESYEAMVAAFINTGKVWYSADEDSIDAFRKLLFHDGKLNPKMVGLSAWQVAESAGISIPETTRLILLKAKGAGVADILCKEKLCPVICILPYGSFEQALDMAQANLEVEGKGHSAAIHSDNEDHIRAAGVRLSVSRLVVNQPSATSAGGSFSNSFSPTTTLGCGSWGNNSISENLNYTHLMNVSRIGKVIASKAPKSLDDIWN